MVSPLVQDGGPPAPRLRYAGGELMDPDRWSQVCAVFDRVADAPPAERPALLAELAPQDAELRR